MDRASLFGQFLSAAQRKILPLVIACGLAGSARGELLYATNGAALSRFDSASLGVVTTLPVTGMQVGETPVGIDVRPATGQPFGVGSSSRIYTIVPTTGVATQVGTAGAFTLNGTAFGTDFNPVPDRVRQVSNTEQNLRLNPNDGTLSATDTALNPAGNIVAVAYDRNDSLPATGTTLFGIDSAAGTLFADFGLPALDEARVGFQATMVKDGARVPVIIGGTSPMVLLRKDDDAPGTTGKFASFVDAVFANSHYAVIGELKPGSGVTATTSEGFWSDSTGVLHLVAQKGGAAPDTNDATFLSFLSIALPRAGGPAFVARLKPGSGAPGSKATAATDLGLWRENAGVTRLIIREGMQVTVGVSDSRTVKTFQVFALIGGPAKKPPQQWRSAGARELR
jgi:hypothetical protein